MKNGRQVLDLKHRLGAVLASYAENGFGKLTSSDDINVNPAAIENPLDVELWRELAVRAGLLIRAGSRCHTIRIPVVEYLIGSFYAWLTKSSPDEDSKGEARRHQRQFVAKFRRALWWREFDDVWLYAFDRLWHGTNEQVEIASGIVEWLLRFSGRCLDCGQDTGDRTRR